MNGRKAKRLREEAYIYARGVDRQHLDPKKVYQIAKDGYKKTAKILRNRFFG